MSTKLIFFTIVITLPIISYWSYIKNKKTIDYRRLLSYFIFGSWFGMCGEIFLDTIINKIFKVNIPLWEYHILPIHDKATSSFGPIMWGIAAVGICFFQHYNRKEMQINRLKQWQRIFIEASFLMLAKMYFDCIGYLIFNDYFFYYFSPELYHFSALINIPFWWCGYKIVVKASDLFYKQEKINITIAILMLTILLWS